MMTDKIHFFYLKHCYSLRDRTRLKSFLPTIFKAEGRDLNSLTYIFCSDKYLLEVNKTYLKHDYYTDIISFNLSGETKSVDGEIYISVDRVVENARKIGVSIKTEIHRVIFHGALHLCGYSDKTKYEKIGMRNKEEEYLDKYFHG